MGSFDAKLLNSLDSIGNFSYSAGKIISSPRQEVSSQTTDTTMHSSNLCLILLPSIYAFAYLRSYGKLLVMSKLYSSRAFNFGIPDELRSEWGCPYACSRSSDLSLMIACLPSVNASDIKSLRYDCESQQRDCAGLSPASLSAPPPTSLVGEWGAL